VKAAEKAAKERVQEEMVVEEETQWR